MSIWSHWKELAIIRPIEFEDIEDSEDIEDRGFLKDWRTCRRRIRRKKVVATTTLLEHQIINKGIWVGYIEGCLSEKGIWGIRVEGCG